MLTFIIPSRTDVLADNLLVSLKHSSPESKYAVIIADNGLSPELRKKHSEVMFVDTPEPFSFAVAVNGAVRHAKPGADLALLNDDVTIESDGFVASLEQILVQAKVQGYGVVSPIIDGGVGNPDQCRVPETREIVLTRNPLCFVAVVIPRPVWDELGGLDEGFPGYGFEDTDFDRRVVESGWKLGVAGSARVRHGYEQHSHSVTFMGRFGADRCAQLYRASEQVFKAKWGDGPQLGAYAQGGPEVHQPIVAG
jgi:GT2 family glycosyltransferase